MYKNIVVAVSLFDDSGRAIIKTAQSMQADSGRSQVLYVVDPRYLQYVFDSSVTGAATVELAGDAARRAKQRLSELCESMGIDASNVTVATGHPGAKIKEFAEQQGCDLIVMGTHGRRGWRRLLGSTANEVLHGTPTNVFLCRSALKDE